VIKKYLFLLTILCALSLHAQYLPLSENSEISILTIGPGSQLNDAFGHNGFRVKDTDNGIDIVYNYGVYDFKTPNFYTKFARGQLLYEIGANNFQPFFDYYKRQNRWVKEQTLDLTYSEKQALFKFLQINVKPENKKYRYDFFYDNCATKIRDVLMDVLGDQLIYKHDHITENYSFRELIQKNVSANTWGSLGMDVAIGSVVDRKAKPIEYQFLPEYIFKGAENAILRKNNSEVPLVKKTETLFEASKKSYASSFFGSPLFVFGLIGLLIIFITYKDHKNRTRNRIADALLFLATGLVGVFILLLWFATDHSATANNYNLLWAVPLSLFFAVLIFKKRPKAWMRRYIFFMLLLLVLMVIHWITGVQVFAIGLIPLLIALAIRYVFLLSYFKTITAHDKR
jgi:hypothetical protein